MMTSMSASLRQSMHNEINPDSNTMKNLLICNIMREKMSELPVDKFFQVDFKTLTLVNVMNLVVFSILPTLHLVLLLGPSLQVSTS